MAATAQPVPAGPSFVPERVDFYDEEGELVKYYVTSDVETIEGKEIATSFVMYDALREGNTTAIKYEDLTFKPKIKSGTFSVKNLRSR